VWENFFGARELSIILIALLIFAVKKFSRL
jgi:hypothetical protein